MIEEENIFEALENFICARCKLEPPFVNPELVELRYKVVCALNEFREDIVRQVLDSFKDNTDF